MISWPSTVICCTAIELACTVSTVACNSVSPRVTNRMENVMTTKPENRNTKRLFVAVEFHGSPLLYKSLRSVCSPVRLGVEGSGASRSKGLPDKNPTRSLPMHMKQPSNVAHICGRTRAREQVIHVIKHKALASRLATHQQNVPQT